MPGNAGGKNETRMTELGDLSDWIWFGAVALWMLTRILPRLFRGRSQASAQPASPRNGSVRQSPARLPDQRLSTPKLPDHQQDLEIQNSLPKAAPIEPH